MATVNYDHPYITIQIFDNTEFKEDEETVERKPFNGMQVGFFAGGRDNQLLYMLNRQQNLREFGKPNFKLYGQAGYNVDAALATDNCGMYVMNLKPDTATFANIIIMVRFKAEDVPAEDVPATIDEVEEPGTGGTAGGGAGIGAGTEIPGIPDPEEEEEGAGTEPGTTGGEETPTPPAPQRLRYSFYAKYVENAHTENELRTAVNALMSVDPDEDGYYNMPFIVLFALGRGEYGNFIHANIANATEYITADSLFLEDEAKPVRHAYTFTIMEPTEEGLTKREISTGTFDIDGFIGGAGSNGASLYMQDIINDLEVGSQRIKSIIYNETLEAICALYNEVVVPGATETPYSLDLFTMFTLDGTINSNLYLDTDAEDYLNVFSLDGFTLKAGKDGWDGMTAEAIAEEKKNLLIKAYSGEIDPYIKSRFSSPCDFNMDACYPSSVKRQMAALANKRMYDLMTYLDMGLASTQSSLLNVATTMRNIHGFNVVKEGCVYSFRDTEYTGKVCQVTMTHWLAKALPNHYATEDTIYGATLARDTAILRSGVDYIRGTFLPVIDPDADDYKETLYKLRVNIYETLTYNSVQRSTAITSCQTKSDRLLEMNEYILQRAVKICYELMASKIYKFGEEEDRSNYEQDATEIINFTLKKYIRSATVEFEMTPKDEKKSLLRLKLHMVFKTVIQKGEVQIYLDPRVTDEATTGVTTSVA